MKKKSLRERAEAWAWNVGRHKGVGTFEENVTAWLAGYKACQRDYRKNWWIGTCISCGGKTIKRRKSYYGCFK